MRRSEVQRFLAPEDVRRARGIALRAAASRAAGTLAVFATVYCALAVLHLVAPRMAPSLWDWPALAHGILLGLAAVTAMRDAVSVGQRTFTDAIFLAHLRRTNR